MYLSDWGWSSAFAELFAEFSRARLAPARVCGGGRGVYLLETEAGRQLGELAGRLEYAADSPLDLPVAGDWVAVTATEPALIVAVLPRRSFFTRAVKGGQRQALAANVDVAFLVCGLDRDWNPARLDRYLLLAAEAGSRPVIVLNKRDLCPDPAVPLRQASALAPSLLLSGWQPDAPELLSAFVGAGETAALFGSSGVGKSTLVNTLLGTEAQATHAVRESDSRGQHTTTARTLLRMPQGWLLLDMPGLREVGVAGDADEAFGDIATLAARCRFTDCGHTGEPGCAVEGNVAPERLANYRKLQREAAYQHRRENAAAERAEKERWKKIHAAMRQRPDKRG